MASCSEGVELIFRLGSAGVGGLSSTVQRRCCNPALILRQPCLHYGENSATVISSSLRSDKFDIDFHNLDSKFYCLWLQDSLIATIG